MISSCYDKMLILIMEINVVDQWANSISDINFQADEFDIVVNT